jgi:hypothetical protein
MEDSAPRDKEGATMPGGDYYDGLSLSAKVLKLGQHHFEHSTRHISAAESEILADASRKLASGRAAKWGLFFVVGAVAIKEVAPRVQARLQSSGPPPEPQTTPIASNPAGVDDPAPAPAEADEMREPGKGP